VWHHRIVLETSYLLYLPIARSSTSARRRSHA
jgi:hypothetical protein